MLCVSYSSLNNITRSFEYHIPRYSNGIKDLSDSCGSLSMISLDAHCGCYQVKVRPCGQNKLVFSLRTGKNEFLKSYPSAQEYTDLLYSHIVNLAWGIFPFLLRLRAIFQLNPPTTIIYDDKIIINDILFSLIIPQPFFVLSQVSPKYLLNVGYNTSCLTVTFSSHGWSSLDLTS